MGLGDIFSKYWFIIVIVVLISLVTSWLKSSSGKGAMGEFGIRFVLGKNIEGERYVIGNLILEDETGKTSQIDHVLINDKGIFVIETKNYSGKIYGNESQREWTQVFQYGKVKNKFYNPVKQNATHIYMLKKALAVSVPIYSVVVFIKADIDEVTADNVFDIEGMQDFIEETPSANISGAQIDEIYHALKEIKENCEISTAEHIQNIEQMKEDIENGICPRCGGALVERTGKNGKFTGCSNYPKCKFTKK